MLRIQST